MERRKCEYYDSCPSVSGWCLINEYDQSCVFHLQQAIKLLKDEIARLERDKNTLWNSYKYR